jgi:hypothetical protein
LLQAGELLAKAQQSNLAIFAFEDVVERDEQSQPIARVQRLWARKVDPVSGADPWLG